MSERATAVLLAVVSVGVIAALLYAGGCFETKLGPSVAAQKLKEATNARRSVCHSGDHGWDYSCHLTYPDGHSIDVDIRVNATSITEQSGP
jgi:hypothetical protein